MPSPLPYRDPKLPVNKRVEDLLQRMGPEEKVGQMLQLDGRVEMAKNIREKQPGSMLQILGTDCAKAQRLAAKTRLGIPLLLGVDAIHGHSFWPDAIMFPTQLGLACSWNPDLARQVGRITACEMAWTGVHWTFSPVLCLARDLRWGRVGETFGEDPVLIGEMAQAMIEGYQGSGLSDRQAVLACAKHFAGYSDTQGGHDASEADLSWRRLSSYFLPPFERAARSGCATFMTGYEAIDGTPCTANKRLLTDTLKKEWGFDGLVVTDWDNVGRMHWEQKVFATIEEAALAAILAGNDLIMATPSFYEAALGALAKRPGLIKQIDNSVKRILTIKFAMGLFEDPRMPDLRGQKRSIAIPAHREAALQAARESVVLLKNNDFLLPLADEMLASIAVVGPGADNPFMQLGDWTLGTGQANQKFAHKRESTVTVLDGIKKRAKRGCNVVYEQGCSATTDETDGIARAIKAAQAADVVVAVVGDDKKYVGEFASTATLALMGAQQQLLEALRETGTPLVVVLMCSKPLATPWIAEHADAVIALWNPGMEGGNALAEILFGDFCPCGKLPITIARHVGQLPVWYNRVPGQHAPHYADMTQEPLWRFGFGLSYTEFEYTNLVLSSTRLKKGQELTVSVNITNKGSRAATEIVQCYLNDKVTSLTWPRKVLKGWDRLPIEPGETRTVTFVLPPQALAFCAAEGQWVVEPGAFEVLVGGSSADESLLRGEFTLL